MKKSKLIIGAISVLAPIGVITPLISCADNTNKVVLTFTSTKGGSIEGPESIEVEVGTLWKDVAKPQTKHETGYRFGQWNDDKGQQIKDDFVISKGMTITAKFDIFNVELTFKDDPSQESRGKIVGGTSTISIQEGKTWADVMSIPQVEILDSNYFFGGWYNATTGKKMEPSTKFMDNTTINPRFDIGEGIKINLVACEHGRIEGPTTIFLDQPAYFGDFDMPSTIANEGYMFIGWRNQENYELDEHTYIDSSETMYACFEKKYTVTFKAGEGGSLIDPQPINVWIGQPVDFSQFPEVQANNNYDFEGWYLNGKIIYEGPYDDFVFEGDCEIEARFILKSSDPTPQEYFEYYVDKNDGYIELRDFKGQQSTVIIPNVFTIDGKEYTDIRLDYTFCNKPYLKEIYIPPNISYIHSFVKDCNNLEKIVVDSDNTYYQSIYDDKIVINTPNNAIVKSLVNYIPEDKNIKTISDDAYHGNSSIENLTIPSNITSIGDSAFLECANLKTLTFAGGVREVNISYYAFSYSGLEKVDFNNVLPRATNSCFTDCEKLSEINVNFLDENSFGEYTFIGSSNISKITLGEYVEDVSFLKYIYSDLKTLIVDENNDWFTSTGDDGKPLNGVFHNIGSGKLCLDRGTGTTILPNNLTQIGDYAFSCISSLEEINISAQIENIGVHVWDYCTNLKHIEVASDNDNYTSKNKNDIECNCLIKINDDESRDLVVGLDIGGLDDTIKSIYDYAFCGRKDITTITIPSSVESIGSSAFEECANLKSVDMSNCQIETIGDYTFGNCYSLSDLKFSESLLTIYEYAFENCRSLISLNLPDSVTYVDEEAFDGVDNLENVHIGANIDDLTFLKWTNSNSNIKSITVSEANTHFTSKNESGGDECNCVMNRDTTELLHDRTELLFATSSSQVPASVTTIGSGCFTNRNLPETYVTPSSIKTIQSNSFARVKNLENLIFNEGVTKFAGDGNSKIYDCIDLKTIVFPSTLTDTSNWTISGCPNLINVDISKCAFTYLQRHFISDCISIPSITIPSSVISFEYSCLYNCPSLKDITIDATDASQITLDGDPVFVLIPYQGTLHVHSQAIADLFIANSPELANWEVDIIGD